MKGFIVGTAVTAIAFYVLTQFLAQVGVAYEGELIGLLVIAAIFGVVNGLIGPLVKVLTLPVSIVSLGLVGFLINAGLLLVTALIADAAGFSLTVGDFPPDLTADSLIAAVIGSVVLSLVGTVVRLVVPD